MPDTQPATPPADIPPSIYYALAWLSPGLANLLIRKPLTGLMLLLFQLAFLSSLLNLANPDPKAVPAILIITALLLALQLYASRQLTRIT